MAFDGKIDSPEELYSLILEQLSDERLEAIVERAVNKRINLHFGKDAIQNPDAALNSGFMPRLEANLRAISEGAK